MVYPILKIAIRLALPLFARKIAIFNKVQLKEKGPLLLAVNHPNSFFDAILLGAFMQQPVHFLTRGDVFKKPWIRKCLHVLNMIPIYRIRDGKDMLSLNEATFLKSVEVLRNNGVLLIFVEGFCENQTTLQLPLKKGAPRILQACWQQGIDAKVLPVWLQYSSFNRIGKTIHIRLGKVFGKEIAEDINSATCMAAINSETAGQLSHLEHAEKFVHGKANGVMRGLLFLPAMFAAILHAPLYLPLQAIAKKYFSRRVHYDSMLVLLLFFLYPFYLLLISAGIYAFTSISMVWPAIFLGMPLLARAYILWKD